MTLLNLAQTWTQTWTQGWAHRAQQHARRNAMVALTECTQRRAEREEVERFLADRDTTRAVRSAPHEHTVSLHA